MSGGHLYFLVTPFFWKVLPIPGRGIKLHRAVIAGLKGICIARLVGWCACRKNFGSRPRGTPFAATAGLCYDRAHWCAPSLGTWTGQDYALVRGAATGESAPAAIRPLSIARGTWVPDWWRLEGGVRGADAQEMLPRTARMQQGAVKPEQFNSFLMAPYCDVIGDVLSYGRIWFGGARPIYSVVLWLPIG